MTAIRAFAKFSRTRFTPRSFAFFCILLTLVASATGVSAQEQSGRKLITQVQPKYPEYLRDHEIGGSVRLNVVVTPNGNVKKVTPIGGNPILLDAAMEAVKQWKYAPSENTDSFEVKLEFTPHKTN